MSNKKKTEDTILNLYWESSSNSHEKIALKDLTYENGELFGMPEGRIDDNTGTSNNINKWPKVEDGKGWVPLPCYVRKYQICFSNHALRNLFIEKGNNACGFVPTSCGGGEKKRKTFKKSHRTKSKRAKKVKTKKKTRKLKQTGGGFLKTLKYKIAKVGKCRKPTLPNPPQKPPLINNTRWESYVKLAHEINKKLNGIPFETLTPDYKLTIEKEAKELAGSCEIPENEVNDLVNEVILEMLPSPPTGTPVRKSKRK